MGWEDYPTPQNPGLSDEDKARQRVLSSLLRDLGLQYVVNKGDISNFDSFTAIYIAIHEESDPSWVSGIDLMSRWKMQPAELADKAPYWLPVHLWNRERGELEVVNDCIPNRSEIFGTEHIPPKHVNFWFAVPQGWWFKRKDVEFCEKVQPELRDKTTALLTSDWKLPEEVQARWTISPYKLEELVRDKGLPACRLDSNKGIVRADEAFFVKGPFGDLLPAPINLCMFRLCDLQAFELFDREKPKKKRSLDLDDRDLDRLTIVDFGEQYLRYHPGSRPGPAIRYLRQTGHDFGLHRDQTIRDYWARGDLKFSHKTGPEKKTS